jgi:hypothetical protein
LYEGILAITVTLMVLAIVAGIIGLVAGFQRISNAARYFTLRNLMVLLVVISLVSVVIVPVLQPTLFNNSNPSTCNGLGGINSPCNSFWGSATANGEQLSWGSDVGWYLAIATVVLLLSAAFVWRAAYSEPWGQGPTYGLVSPIPPAGLVTNSPTGPIYFPPVVYTQPPLPAPSAPPPAIAERYCPRCGGGNAKADAFCQKCGKPLPPPPS